MDYEPYLLFVDASVRPPVMSRTRTLCERYLMAFKRIHPFVRVRRLPLAEIGMKPKDARTVLDLENLRMEDRLSDPVFDRAREFASAWRILVGAPYWDFSFPSILKIYFENICMNGVTFVYENNRPKGLCHAQRIDYITSAGGRVGGYDLGGAYTRKLCAGLLGIKHSKTLIVDKLDIAGAKSEKIMRKGCARAERMAR